MTRGNVPAAGTGRCSKTPVSAGPIPGRQPATDRAGGAASACRRACPRAAPLRCWHIHRPRRPAPHRPKFPPPASGRP